MGGGAKPPLFRPSDPEEHAHIVMSVDALALGKGPRVRFYIVPAREGPGFDLGLQITVFDLVAAALQQVFRFQTAGAAMLRHDHAIAHGGFAGALRHAGLAQFVQRY
ncbi:hypothetical protein AL036_20835 [Salipiger aestuarii]|nr:hypothetical protein AL036_20835 [Salipiger aestuarii]